MKNLGLNKLFMSVEILSIIQARTGSSRLPKKVLFEIEGIPVIKEIKRVSKPGRRIYSKATSIPKIQNGLGLAILSTPKGVMSDNDARKNNLGGEIICRVF